MQRTKLSTKYACRIVGLDRQRLNEFVALGAFPCAPPTIPGRARYFDPDDMISLWLFRQLMDDGFDAAHAGRIACRVAAAARDNPDARAISYVWAIMTESGFSLDREALPSDQLPDSSTWNKSLLHGNLIEKTMTFNIWQLRQRLEHLTKEEVSFVGDDD